jgi:hypothetical protein
MIAGRPARSRHGSFAGYQRFGSREAAKKWVEGQGFFRKTRGRWVWISSDGRTMSGLGCEEGLLDFDLSNG